MNIFFLEISFENIIIYSKTVELLLIILLFIISLLFINKYNPYLRTDLFRYFAKGNWYLTSDKDELYAIGYHGVMKYRVFNTNKLKLLATNSDFCKNRIFGRSGCISGDFLYIAARSFLPGGVKTNKSIGLLLVMKKTDLSLVHKIDSDIKLVEVKIYDKTLVVSGINGFNIYDLNIPSNPKEIFAYRHPKFREYQGFDLIKRNDLFYVAFSLFTEGLEIWDISNPQNAKPICLIPINKGMFPLDELPDGQSMDVLASYPYVFATLGPTNETYKTEKDRRGIIVYDISDINNIKKSAVLIPETDWYKRFKTTGDKQPTYIERYKNRLYVNFAEKGLAVFDITNESRPIYLGLIAVSRMNVLIQPIHVTENDKLFSGSYYWKKIYARNIDKTEILKLKMNK